MISNFYFIIIYLCGLYNSRILKEKEKIKVSKKSYKKSLRLFKYISPYKGTFFIGFLFLLVTGATSLAFPKLMGGMIDASKGTAIESINQIALTLLIVFIFQAVASFFRVYTFSYVTENALANLRTDVYKHLISLPMSFFASRRVGELNSRISSDVSVIQETLTTTIAEFIRQIIIIIGSIVLLSMISVKLTLFILATVPVIALVAVVFGKFIKKLSKQTQDKIAESNTIVEETFQGIASVKAFVNESFELNRYSGAVAGIVSFAMRGAKWRGAFISFITLCVFGSIVGVVWYGSILVQDSSSGLTIGNLISFILYTVFIGASFGGVATQFSQIQKAVGATENLLDLFDEKAEVINFDFEEGSDSKIFGEITFKNVQFAYPSRTELEILKSISFDIKQGQQVAIVGASGAGKSTITTLIQRFYDATAGSIKIDNKAIESFDLTTLRNQMAIVPQDVFLFGGTIKENIAYGKPTATIQEIEEAAKKANALDFVNSFPEQFETIVGERGIQLSGGQRQRIAIARAILKDPSILILDEATSSLDSESERLVQDALEKLMKGRTSIVIAHRLSTIKNADKIIVLDNGHIKEEGTHSQLMEKGDGVYRKLNNIQFELN
jgi:ABC-type multidrug transport system fused ATPase/permease subunit